MARLDEDGRKRYAGSALFTADGTCLPPPARPGSCPHDRAHLARVDEPGRRGAYVEYLQETGAPNSLGTPGNRGFILRQPVGEREEFVTVSLWDSLEAVKAFAGEDIENAVFYPEDDRFLVEREWTADHFEWITGTDRAPEA